LSALTAAGEPRGAGRVSVSRGPDGAALSVETAPGETLVFDVDFESAVELAASFFFVALCDPKCDPDALTARFGELLERKGQALKDAQHDARVKREGLS
jgi:hypothetical protein